MTDVAYVYASGRSHVAQGDFVWKAATTTNYMALYNSTLTPDQAAADVVYSNTNELATAAGYTQAGAAMTITDPTLVGSAPNAYAKLAGSDVTWGPTATFTGVRTIIIYKNTGTKYLLGYIKYDADKAAQGGYFTVTCPATGWFDF